MKNKDFEKMVSLIKDIRVAMLTTMDENGELRSRPMATNSISEEGIVYFFTEANAPKIEELDTNNKVNISYIDRDEQVYVSISGYASQMKDKNKIAELWTPYMKAWFPKGKEDPNLCLLKVKISKAEYWDVPSNQMVQLSEMAKAVVEGKQYKAGENKKINL